jgi:hypothetical protein
MTPCARRTSTRHPSRRRTAAPGPTRATAIVIEEVARACAASSLIPAVNKLGTLPLLRAGSEALSAPGRGRTADPGDPRIRWSNGSRHG